LITKYPKVSILGEKGPEFTDRCAALSLIGRFPPRLFWQRDDEKPQNLL